MYFLWGVYVCVSVYECMCVFLGSANRNIHIVVHWLGFFVPYPAQESAEAKRSVWGFNGSLALLSLWSAMLL